MANAAKRGPAPPKHLSDESKALWRRLCGEFEFTPVDLERLRCACESRDRMDAARETLDELGTTFLDRFQTPRPRPEVAIERDSRLSFLRALRELGLDLADVESPRPPAMYK